MDKHELEVDMVVFLRPTTKLAPQECHERLPARIESTDRWPLVEVVVREGTIEQKLLTVHYRNVGKKPRAAATQDKKRGDSSGNATELDTTRRHAAFSKHKPIALPEGMEELPLW